MAIYSGNIPQFSDPSSYKGLPQDMLKGQHVNAVEREEDKRLDGHIKFFVDAWFESAESARQDRPVFSLQTFVEVTTDPMSHVYVARLPKKKTRAGKEVWSNEALYWQRRFPTHWKRFEQIESKQVGMPLSFLPNLQAGEKATLEACGITTIEQCALLDQGFKEQYPELEQVVIKCQRWLDNNDLVKAKDEELEKLKAELEQLKSKEVQEEVKQKTSTKKK